VRGAPRRDWRRRTLRTRGGQRLRVLARSSRILTLLLTMTGCAIETPRPVAMPLSPGPMALVTPPVLSRFGEWRGEGGAARPARHAGIDIRAGSGTPVLAAADGVVLRTGSQVFAGRLVVVAHDTDRTTVYYHLSAVEVVPGQAVRRGDVVGRVGASGNATAPHLHFGLCWREGGQCGERIDGGWQDPTRHWIAGNPCFVPGRAYSPRSEELTYPVPCHTGPGTTLPSARAPGGLSPARALLRPA
jgi:murein DD-endopeptidase MepM/ murein hydrolase activator NlpD